MTDQSQKSIKSAPSIYVDPGTTGVKCGGGNGVLGHPEVYYSFGSKSEIVCHYCGQHFIRAQK